MSKDNVLDTLKPVVIDASNVSVEIISEKLLINLIKKALEDEATKNNISIKLTPDIINTINNIITLSPNTITDIEKAVVDIVNDEKIDIKDVPEVIILIQRLYQFIYSLKNTNFDSKKRVEITSSALKFIIHLLVLERKIKIDKDKQEKFFKETDNLIDSCVGLLSFPKIIKTKNCLKKLFG
jgi:hypothetical protein